MKFIKTTSYVVLALALVMLATFHVMDKETQALNDEARRSLNVSFTDLSHGTVHYTASGEARLGTVVLVHGFSIPSYLWGKNVNALVSAGYKVLSFDLYGRGYSDRPELDYTIDLFVEQLSEITQKLLPGEPFHLVGISMGGPITTRFSHQHPEQVQSLTLLAPLVETPERLDLTLLGVPLLGEFLSSVVMMPKLANGLANTVYDVNAYPEWHERFSQHVHFEGYRRALLSTARYLTGRSFVGDYQKLNDAPIPTQLVWGVNDQVVHYTQHHLIKEVVPDIPFFSLDKTGHLPQIEQADRVNKLIINHLNQFSDKPS